MNKTLGRLVRITQLCRVIPLNKWIYINSVKSWHHTNEIYMMMMLGKVNFLAPASGLLCFFPPVKHFIFYSCLVHWSICHSRCSHCAWQKQSHVGLKRQRGNLSNGSLFENILWHNHVFSLKAQGRPVCQIAVLSWLPGLNRNSSCVLIEPRGTLKPYPFCFTLSARRLKSGKHYRRLDNCPCVSSRQKATLRQFPR